MAIVDHEIVGNSVVFNCVKDVNGKLYSVEESIVGSFFKPIDIKDLNDTLQAQLEGNNIPLFFQNAPVVDVEKVVFNTTGFPKVPKEQFVAITKLFNYYAKDMGSLEVGCMILVHELNGIRFVVPQQTVSSGSVGWNTSQVTTVADLVTGVTRSILDWYEEGWNSLGCAHSHNTMKLSTPSSTDDARELPWSGWYLLLSSFEWHPNEVVPKFVITTTITVNKKRYSVQPEWCLESPTISEEDWHRFNFAETVLSLINRYTPRFSFGHGNFFNYYGGHATQKNYLASWSSTHNQGELSVSRLIQRMMTIAKHENIPPNTLEEYIVEAFFDHFPQYSLDFLNDPLDVEESPDVTGKEPLLITGSPDIDDPFFFADYPSFKD